MGIKIILAVVLLLISVGGYIGAYFISDKDGRYSDRKSNKKSKMLILGSSVVVLLFLIFPWSFFSISTGEIGVVKVFGEAKETVSPGIHYKFWVSNTIERYDIKTREINLDFQAYSKDAQTVTGQLAVQYQIKPDMIMDINRQYGSIDILESKLKAVILERTKSVFADKGAMLIVESRSSLSGEIEQRILPTMEQYNIIVTMIALSDISFNDAFESAVEQKMVAEQEQLRASYDKERAIIKADERLAVAEREAQATIQKAQGDAEALKIMQGAWGALGFEVREAMLRQMFYEKWNGVLPEVMAGDNLDLIIGSK
ncbi:MAG: prohibitin family protein [Oscillospiraceae bacterium]|nr:prohibitin family protein [Oscillospiraceae bacterium]